MSDKRKPRDRDRKFRRPEIRPERMTPAEEAEANLPAVPPNPAELGVVMQPLKDLADAFRQNTETLQSIADGQARLGRRIDRADRSEAVINSTQALNDTFRGVKRTQEQLIGRLTREQKRPWWFLAAAFLAGALVVGGGLYVLLDGLARRDESSARGGAQAFTGALSEKDEALGDALRENRELSVDLATSNARAGDLSDRVNDLVERVGALEKDNARLVARQLEMDGISRENSRLLTENGRLEDELSAARRELKAAREDLVIAKEAAAKDAKRPGAEPAAPAAVPPEKKPSAVPEGAVTDTAELDRVRNILNQLLADTARSSYRIERIGGLRGKMLYDIVIVDGATGDRDAKKFEAREGRIAIDAVRKRIEIRLQTGYITYYGVRARFWDDRYVLPLTEVETKAWIRSGLTIFESI